MKKKLLSLFLALTLALSLAAPALAAEAEPTPAPPANLALADPMNDDIDAWIGAHMEEVEAFDPHAYFAGQYSYYDSEEEYMELWEIESQEAFEANMRDEWVASQVMKEQLEAQWAQLLADKPQETAMFLADFDGWFAQQYYWYDSFEDYCETRGITEGQAYLSLYEAWTRQQEEELAARKERDAYLTAHGGIPGELNVMVNGTCLTFPEDAKPYAEEGVTYVNAETLNAALGTELTGSVPLREAAEAAGYTVEWDADYNTAVLYSHDVLVGKLDESFTVANQLMAGPQDGKTHTVSGKFSGELKLFNTLDGDETYRYSGKMDSAMKDGSGSVKISLDLKDLAKLPGLADLWEGMTGDTGFLDAAQAKALSDALKNFELEVLLDREAGLCYVRSPLLTAMEPEAFPEDAWVSSTLPEETLSVGALVADLSAPSLWSTSPVQAWDKRLSAAQLYVDVFGDARFAPKGDGWDYKLDTETVAGILENYYQQLQAYDPYYYYDPYSEIDWAKLFKTCKVDLHVTADGGATGSFAIRPDYAALFGQALPGMGSIFTTLMPGLDYQMEGKYSRNGSRLSGEITYHFKNTLELTAKSDLTLGTSGKAPQTAPGEGETVVEPWGGSM